MKILILGGGASGMMAALSAASDPRNTVTVLERQGRVGKKLMATGNGRCNLTNTSLTPENYHGADPAFVLPALEAFGVERTLDFFHSLGLLTVTEPGGRVYPLSDQANSVVDVLRFTLEARGVSVVCGCDVVEVRKKARGWQALAATGEAYFGDKLIVACGGCAGKKIGGTRSGYHLLSMLGHSCTELLPALTQSKTDTEYVRSLKGVRADCSVRLKKEGQTTAQSAGELQFTEFGISGPVTFEISRAASVGGEGQTVILNFLRHYDPAQGVSLLLERRTAFPALPAEELLSGFVQARLGKVIVKRAGLSADTSLSDLTDDELRTVVSLIQGFSLRVEGVMGMDSAQVTVGGVPTCEFDPYTLESRLAPNVYATGEVLDIDGDCGGFNLQWAWSSGWLAGRLGEGGRR